MRFNNADTPPRKLPGRKARVLSFKDEMEDDDIDFLYSGRFDEEYGARISAWIEVDGVRSSDGGGNVQAEQT